MAIENERPSDSDLYAEELARILRDFAEFASSCECSATTVTVCTQCRHGDDCLVSLDYCEATDHDKLREELESDDDEEGTKRRELININAVNLEYIQFMASSSDMTLHEYVREIARMGWLGSVDSSVKHLMPKNIRRKRLSE